MPALAYRQVWLTRQPLPGLPLTDGRPGHLTKTVIAPEHVTLAALSAWPVPALINDRPFTRKPGVQADYYVRDQ
jgi:hypothetical protein